MVNFIKPDKNKKIWFTSDIHGFHTNICSGVSNWPDTSRCRKFDNELEMTKFIVNNINDKVDDDDILFSLGDWSFGGRNNIALLRSMIKCKNVFHIIGNHDHHIQKHKEEQDNFQWIGFYNEFRYKGTKFCMSHYPISSWNEIGKGSVMLHGHCHGTHKLVLPRRFDVGVDVEDWNYSPVSIDTILDIAKSQDIADVDHHDSKTQYGR